MKLRGLLTRRVGVVLLLLAVAAPGVRIRDMGSPGLIAVAAAQPRSGRWPQLQVPSDHEIGRIAFSPDGRVVATVGSGESSRGFWRISLKFWDSDTGDQLRTIDLGESRGTTGLAFHPSGRLVAAGVAGRLYLFDVDKETPVKVLEHFSGERGSRTALAVAFAPSGKVVATAGAHSVKFWDVGSGRLLRSLDAFDERVFPDRIDRIAFSGDGKRLAVSCSNSFDKPPRPVRVFKTASGEMIQEVSIGSPAALGSTPAGDLAAISRDNGVLVHWNLDTRQSTKLTDLGTSVVAAGLSRGGRWIVSFSDKVSIFDVAAGRVVRSMPPVQSESWKRVSVAAVSADGKRTATRGFSNLVLRNVGPTISTIDIPSRAKSINWFAASADGRWMVLSPRGGQSLVWHVPRSGPLRLMRTYETLENPRQISGDGRLLVVEAGFRFHIDDVATGRRIRTVTPKSVSGRRHRMTHYAFGADGRALAALGEAGVLHVWDVETGNALMDDLNLRQTYESPSGLVLSPSGRWLVASVGGRIAIIDTRRWAMSKQFDIPLNHYSDPVHCVFSPDEDYLMVASAPSKGQSVIKRDSWRIDIFSTANWQGVKTRTVPGTKAGLVGAGSSDDGRLLALSDEGLVRVFSVPALTDVLTVPNHEFVGFLPGKRLVTKSRGDTAVFSRVGAGSVWDLASGRRVGSLDSLGTVSAHAGSKVAFDIQGSVVHLRDSATFEHLAALVALSEDFWHRDWAVATRGGFFDGTSDGIRNILLRFGPKLRDVVPLELYLRELYTPDLLPHLMAGLRPGAPGITRSADRRHPTVRLSGTVDQPDFFDDRAPMANIVIEVAEAPAAVTPGASASASASASGSGSGSGSGAYDLRLFRNGSLVRLWRGDALRGKTKESIPVQIPLVNGENEFSAYAFSRNDIKSRDALLRLHAIGTAYSRVNIVSIGVNDYAVENIRLRYAAPDAKVFAAVLQDEFGRSKRDADGPAEWKKFWAVTEVEPVTLVDRQATKERILTTLAKLGRRSEDGTAMRDRQPGDGASSRPQDVVIIFFAGHGVTYRDNFYLLPQDFAHGAPQGAQFDLAFFEAHRDEAISEQELEEVILDIDASRLLLILDTCYAGQILETEETRRGPLNVSGLAQLAYEKGVYVLGASQGYQQALEVGELQHGLLTYALVQEGLKGGQADRFPADGRVVLREWLDYAVDRVPQLQAELGISTGRGVRIVAGSNDYSAAQRPRVYYRRQPETRALVIANRAPSR